MPLISFSYQKQIAVDDDGVINIIHRPYVPVRFKYKNYLNKTPYLCLIDSGADRNLFPWEIGELLDIKIKSGRKRIHIGIGDINVESYIHEVDLFIGGYRFTTEIDFSFEQKVPLLGRNMFFRFFKKIVFEENKKIVKLEY